MEIIHYELVVEVEKDILKNVLTLLDFHLLIINNKKI
jgi:hypothetical protein